MFIASCCVLWNILRALTGNNKGEQSALYATVRFWNCEVIYRCVNESSLLHKKQIHCQGNLTNLKKNIIVTSYEISWKEISNEGICSNSEITSRSKIYGQCNCSGALRHFNQHALKAYLSYRIKIKVCSCHIWPLFTKIWLTSCIVTYVVS